MLLLQLFSCNNFLDISPQTSRNTKDFFNTEKDFDAALAGNYAALKMQGTYSGSLSWMGETSTDNGDYGANRQALLAYQFQFVDLNYTSLNTIIYAAWRDHYIGIGRSNLILEHLPDAAIQQSRKDQFEGEAKFLRALFYFNLVRLFGGVPLVTHEVTSPDEGDAFPRSTVDEVYNLIISDLTTAVEKLPETYSGGGRGRATSGAAGGLLGKVYLTRGQWEECETVLQDVIDAGNYRLLDDYAAVFDYNTPINAEILFNVQYQSGQTGQGSDFWWHFGPAQGGSAVYGSGGGTGDGRNMPTEDMDNAYEEGDLRKDFSMQDHYTRSDGTRTDVRFITKFKQYGAIPGDSDVDFPVLRYSDVLLMYAEALVEQDRVADGLEFVNQVRNRAGLDPVSVSNQEAARRLIAQERRVELAFEFHRWFDLVRTGRYIETMVAKGYNARAHHILFLIPQRELDINDLLTQNDGY